MQRRLAKISSVFMLLIVMFSSMSITAFAASSFKIGDADTDSFEALIAREDLQIPVYTDIALDAQGGRGAEDETTDIYLPLFKQSDNADAGRYFFNRVDFARVTKKEQEKLLKDFVAELNNSDISAGGRRKIYNSIRDTVDPTMATVLPRLVEESTPNVYRGLSILRPFTGTVGTVLGVAVILLVLLMVVSTVIDLAWMNLPMFQNMTTEKANETGAKKPLFASMDAVIAMREFTEGITQHRERNFNVIYFKRRSISYLVMAVCILYLISGQIADVIVWLLDFAGTLLGGV